MITKVFEYKVLDENGNHLGFKLIDVTKDQVVYLDKTKTKSIDRPKNTMYLQQLVTVLGKKKDKNKTNLYSGDVLHMHYDYNPNYTVTNIIGFHDRIKAFRLYTSNGKKNNSLGNLSGLKLIRISNVISERILLSLKHDGIDIDNYVIKEKEPCLK